MSDEIKRAIKSAQERLETETNERLTNEIHAYLKEELDSIEKLKAQKREFDNKIRIHEENIKNLKSGNLEAIERRRRALHEIPRFTWTTTSTGNYFYNNHVAGFTYQSPLTGITYTF